MDQRTTSAKDNLPRLCKGVTLLMLVVACASAPPGLQDEPPNWEIKFDHWIEFQSLVDDGLLVVGTQRHLYGIDPTSGQELWRQRNVAVTSNDLTSLGKGSYLLVNDAAGGAFDDRDTNIIALDQQSGAIVWESKLLEGKILQGTLDAPREVLFITSVVNAHGDDRGFMSGTFGRKGLGSGFKQQPHLSAMDVSTGRFLWTRAFTRPVMMRPVYRPQLDEKSDYVYTRPFDLGLYHPPVTVGDLVCVTYEGINCYEAGTGQPAWEDRFSVIEDELALSYAIPVLHRTSIITSGDHRVRAFDQTSGEVLWRSRRFDIIPELLVDEFTVFGQLGGHFFDIDKEKWEWEGDFGAVALDRETGETIWKYEDADDSVTNLLVYDDNVWLADEDHLIALDRIDGSVRFQREHEFKDPPLYAALNEAMQIVLVGEGEVAAFDSFQGEQIWRVRHAPVGPGAWRRFSTGLLHASGNILKFSSFVLSQGVGLLPSLVVPLGSVDFKIINTKRIVSTSLARSGRRMTYQTRSPENGVGKLNLSGNFQYFVTRPKGTDNVVLAVVNLSSGETERMVRMDADYPNIVIDEGHNKIYETFGQQLLALPLDSGALSHPSVSQQTEHEVVPYAGCCRTRLNSGSPKR